MPYIFLFLFLLSCGASRAQRKDLTVLFKSPAAHFTESLPVGNGRLGAMMYGKTGIERISLNEISLWSGGPQNADNDSAHFYLKPIQQLLIAGKNQQAQEILQKHFVAKGAGSGLGRGANEKYGAYQALGDLLIDWKDTAATVTAYRRYLDLENAMATTSYERDGNSITEELFADFVNDILWLRIKSKKKDGIHIRVSLSRQENAQAWAGRQMLFMAGTLPAAKDKGMRFAAVVKPRITDGTIKVQGNDLIIDNSSECILMISAATDYHYADGKLTGKDPMKTAQTYLAKAAGTSFAAAQRKSIFRYQSIFNRCRWYMPASDDTDGLTTQERLIRYHRRESDPTLPVLYFNFGRYLLISSSRPGLLPANLQGLWATEYQTPWNGDYHLNINLQMNYWPAEVTNLSQLSQPLFQFTKNLVPNGEKTAKAYYDAPGWVAHVISNPWFYTSPGEGADWGSTLTGGAWLCGHIWQHFLFTRDSSFLKKYYPVMKGAARFLQAVLVREPDHGWLVTAPSNSPENTYIMPGGFRGQTAMGPAMDMQICRELFNACIRASVILDTDNAWREELSKTIAMLAPNQISPTDGGIQEWLHDWPSAEPQHRHVSQLYGLYPYDEITPWSTPLLAAAARRTLELRGDGGTGWSKAWKINFWARLGDGDHALKLLRQLLQPTSATGTEMKSGGGTYPNLFCAHPPFQIDGNFGGTAGIAEMLLQSHGTENVIRFLPALPSDDGWKDGLIQGLKARGNFEITMKWTSHQLDFGQITSEEGGVCKLWLPSGKHVYSMDGARVATTTHENNIISFQTRKGESFMVR